jgi:hypothetical protein
MWHFVIVSEGAEISVHGSSRGVGTNFAVAHALVKCELERDAPRNAPPEAVKCGSMKPVVTMHKCVSIVIQRS